MIADNSLKHTNGELNYSIENAKISAPNNFKINSGISLYKLHGSMNWLICPNEKCNSISIYSGKIAQFAEDPNKNTRLKCEYCGQHLKRIIVPPRWDKEKSYSDILNNIWKKAFEKLLEADIVYVIGYSLPESDIYARFLLSSALNYNPNLEIHVINSNADIQKKYRTFLMNSNIDLKRYKSLPYKFKEYIDLMY